MPFLRLTAALVAVKATVHDALVGFISHDAGRVYFVRLTEDESIRGQRVIPGWRPHSEAASR